MMIVGTDLPEPSHVAMYPTWYPSVLTQDAEVSREASLRLGREEGHISIPKCGGGFQIKLLYELSDDDHIRNLRGEKKKRLLDLLRCFAAL